MGNSESASAHQAFKAVRTGNEKKLQQLLGKKLRNINVQDTEGSTLLSVAVQTYNPSICNLLINSGANINVSDTRGLTPLHKAITYSFDEKLILMLLKSGAEIDHNHNDYKRTPLVEAIAAGNEKIAELLINNGADVNVADKDGMTPLHWAAQTGNEALVRSLLDHQADVNARDKSNATPLLKAKSEDHVHIIKILEKHFCKLYKIECSDSEEGDGAEGITGAVDPAAAAAAIIMGWGTNNTTSTGGNGSARGANDRNSTSSNGSTNSKQDVKEEVDGTKKKKKKKKAAKEQKKEKKGKKKDASEEKKKKKKKKKKADKDDKDESDDKSSCSQSQVVATKKPKTREEELLALDESKFCKICFERPMDTVLLGCGHVAICMFCSQYLQQCPMCSAAIEKVSKIYFS